MVRKETPSPEKTKPLLSLEKACMARFVLASVNRKTVFHVVKTRFSIESKRGGSKGACIIGIKEDKMNDKSHSGMRILPAVSRPQNYEANRITMEWLPTAKPSNLGSGAESADR